MRRDWIGFTALVLVMAASLAVLFDRTWRFGERLSPADLIFTTFPWAADTARVDPSNPVRSDEAFYFQPTAITHFGRMRAVDFPDLNPHTLAGVPAFHQGLDTGRAYSPLALPYYLVDANLATTIYGPLRLLVAALVMWWWLRGIGVSRLGAITGAVAFGLNGAFIVWLSSPQPDVALFLPLLALGADRIVGTDRRGIAVFALALGLMWIGCYAPTLIISSTAVACLIAAGLAVRARRSGARAVVSPLAMLVVASIAGCALGAVSIVPTAANLATSPVAARTMGDTLPWANLATFALPDFWGTPIRQNWWYSAAGNYSEFVTYLGVSTVALAGAGFVRACLDRDTRSIAVSLVGMLALGAMYGAPPGSWIDVLPPLRQTNPHRWHVVLAFVVATLAARGVEGLTTRSSTRDSSDADSTGRSGSSPSDMQSLATMPVARASRTERLWLMAGAVLALGALAAAAGLSVAHHLEDIRRLNLQAFERAQIVRAAIIAATATALAVVATTRQRAAAFAGWSLIALVAFDLVGAGRGFNPTLAPGRIYPPTPALERLHQLTGAGRVAFVGEPDTTWPGEVWGVYGLDAVDGFDFHGDTDYQRLLARASGRADAGTTWDVQALGPPERLRVRWLDLLGVTSIVTPPLDAVAAGAGYSIAGELTAGSVVEQPFTARFNGLRTVDVLTATYGRRNEGTVTVSLIDSVSSRALASRTIEASSVSDNEWTRLEFGPLADSGGRGFRLRVAADGAGPGRAATLWMTASAVDEPSRATVSGVEDTRSVWFRTFSAPPARIEGATLVESGAINVYRSNTALPRAWCVPLAEVAPLSTHFDRMASPSFDARHTALLADVPRHTPTESARVVAIDTTHADARRIDVDAPDGGLLVVSERHHPSWTVVVDGQPVTPHVADGLLTAVPLPPGSRSVVMEFRDASRPWSVALSTLALAGIAFALVRRG